MPIDKYLIDFQKFSLDAMKTFLLTFDQLFAVTFFGLENIFTNGQRYRRAASR
ncbi:hypothetical protein PHSC3_000969 [Chlamydiales bacterium STE3]|nr:hypothetical protein PHSC3_000969 [Chlamydiales bacterium STE3]